jgi:UDPglucose 6-dehydrogenase
VAFSALARANGAPALLAEATDKLNRQQVPRLGAMILARLPKGGTAGVLGLSYKPDTGVIEESQGVALAKYLLQSGARVVVYDPEAMDNAREQLEGRVTFVSGPAECARQSDVLAITTPWPEFKKLMPQDFKRPAAKPVVLDCWRILPREKFEDVVEYLTLGYGAHPDARATEERVMAAEGD